MIECDKYKCNECLIKAECDTVDCFIDDQNYTDIHKMLVSIYNKSRADAIDELVSWIKHEEADGKIHSLDDYDRIAKQLKEKKE